MTTLINYPISWIRPKTINILVCYLPDLLAACVLRALTAQLDGNAGGTSSLHGKKHLERKLARAKGGCFSPQLLSLAAGTAKTRTNPKLALDSRSTYSLKGWFPVELPKYKVLYTERSLS